jgi:tetratricopeptide (TPR) repeat protein
VEHFRLAVQLDPGSAPAHCNLGVIRAYSAGLGEAIEHFREALRLDPGCAMAYYHLGVVLLAKSPLDTANDSYQRALRDDPKNRKTYEMIYPLAHRHGLEHYQWAVHFDPRWALTPIALGLTLQAQRRLSEALDHYNQALASDPQLALAEGARGQALLAQGRFPEALTATRRCLELMAQGSYRIEAPALRADVDRNLHAQLRRCERLLKMERRLPAILPQEDKASAGEYLEFAELCAMKGRYAAAAGLYADAFGAELHLAEDLDAGRRYNAACAAALAGFGRGADSAGLSGEERARWRQQARTWLRADVEAWVRKLDTGVPAERELVRKVSARWWAEPGLAWLHDAGIVEGLPPAERQECLALWQDAGAVLRRAQPTR